MDELLEIATRIDSALIDLTFSEVHAQAGVTAFQTQELVGLSQKVDVLLNNLTGENS
jgi:hypothetical protein